MVPSSPPPIIQVDIEPIGKRITIKPGSTVLEAIQKSGIDITTSCGGTGFCGTCLVQIIQGKVNPVSSSEANVLDPDRKANGFRLACQTIALSDVKIHIPPESFSAGQQLQIEGQESPAILSPAVTIKDFQLQNKNNDSTQTFTGSLLVSLQIDQDQRKIITDISKKNHGIVRLVMRDSRILSITDPGKTILGLAIDIGSTKMAFYVVDLQTGGTLAMVGVMNPQIAFGEDVISRIAYAEKGPTQRHQLQSILIKAINSTVADLCARIGGDKSQICDCVVVGNTVIHHLFCGLPVSQLGAAPYLAAKKEALAFPAAELGILLAPEAQIYLPPIIAGYVGADHVAALSATLFLDLDKARMLIDIGTNTEISLASAGKIYSCSCASGPAFEGAYIRDGMRALPGAIKYVEISTNGEVSTRTIGDKPPIGLCGSGILSAVSELHRLGIVDMRGVIRWQDQKEFPLVKAACSGHRRDIIVTRKDIHEIQLAKGAIRAGIEVLLSHAGIDANQVEEWVIAGAFGTHIDIRSALSIGMFPAQPLERFHQVGNAAGMGAKKMLLSQPERTRANEFLHNIEYVELTTEPGFQDTYIQSLYFPN
jgi:uncharacterized 2Fe-2S/4Fe-4S cluster protein (DUF4445 family)